MKHIARCLGLLLLWLASGCRSEQVVFHSRTAPISPASPQEQVGRAGNSLPGASERQPAAGPSLAREVVTPLAVLPPKRSVRPRVAGHAARQRYLLSSHPPRVIRAFSMRRPPALAEVQDGPDNLANWLVLMGLSAISLLLLLIGLLAGSGFLAVLGGIGFLICLYLLLSGAYIGH